MNKRISIITAAVVVIAITTVVVVKSMAMDDATLRTTLVGKWKALDVENASLHHRKAGVAAEEVDFHADGSLIYHITPKPGQGEAENDTYAWEIVKGKLQLKQTGKDSADDVLPRLRVKVSTTRLKILRRGYSDKIFERISP